jgi:hypothetical protein
MKSSFHSRRSGKAAGKIQFDLARKAGFARK